MMLYSKDFRVSKMAVILDVSARGYYAWLKRGVSRRELADRELSKKIEKIFDDSKGVYGSRKIRHELQRIYGERVGRNRVLRLMNQRGLFSKVRKKYKATTNSNHGLPVAKNILNREFDSEYPNQKLVSDITYIWTDEGWLYLAAVMDLCGSKIVGASMGARMTKELVMNALTDAVNRSGKSDNGILHSDRGSQVRREVA